MNRCSDCGKFAPWDDLEMWEHNDLDLHGQLSQEWGFAHRRGVGCRSESRPISPGWRFDPLTLLFRC